jgi:ankyrin repeat protein
MQTKSCTSQTFMQSLLPILRRDDSEELSQMLPTIRVDLKFDPYWDDLLGMASYSPPLISVAAFYGAANCFALLNEHDADLKATDFFKTPVTHFAAAGGSLAILQALLDMQERFAGAAFPAIEHNQLEALKWLLTRKLVTPRDVDARGYSMLYVAIENHAIDIVKYIVANNAILPSNVPAVGPICFAIQLNDAEVTALLVGNKKTNINEADADGVSLLLPILRFTWPVRGEIAN